jgi:hypothetical protein
MSKAPADETLGFDAHLRHLNARRLRSASWYFAAAILALLAANLAVPSLRLWLHAGAQIVVALYFFSLGLVCRSARAADCRPPRSAAVRAGSRRHRSRLQPRSGPARGRKSRLFDGDDVACLAPGRPGSCSGCWSRYAAYLATVWHGDHAPTFILVMTVGGTVAVALGWFVATLAYRAEQQARRRRRHSPPEGRTGRGVVAGQPPARRAKRNRRSSRMSCKVRSRASVRFLRAVTDARRRTAGNCRKSPRLR